VLLDRRPSLHPLRRSLHCVVRRLHRYYGVVRLLSGVRVRLVVIYLPGPVPIRSGRPRGLPVLVHIVSRRARGLRLRRVRRATREFTPPADVAFPQTEQGRHANLRFRSSLPCPRCLCLRFACRLTTTGARLEVRMESLFLSCRALSSPAICRFIPALSVPRFLYFNPDDPGFIPFA